MARERGGRRPGTATGHCRRLYQSICPSSRVQQLEVPDAHICRFSPCGQYLVCFAGGFTQLVVFRFTGPRVSWQGERSDAELSALLASFSCFFTPLYRVQLAPAGEMLARDVVLFMGGGGLLLTASHSPFTAPLHGAPLPPDADARLPLPFAESITLHLVRLSDGVRVGGSRLEGELVDLSGRPGSLGVSVHEDLIAVLALRSQEIHLLQVLRGGEEVLRVRSLGPHVAEDDELVLRTAAEAEERWLRARRAEREAGGRAPALQGLTPRPPAGLVSTGEDSVPALLPTLRRNYNGDLVRAAELGPGPALQNSAAVAAAPGPSPVTATVPAAAAAAGVSRNQAADVRTTRAAAGPSGVAGRPTSRSPPPLPPRYGTVGLDVGATTRAVGRQAGTASIMEGGVAVDTDGGDAAGGSGSAGQPPPPPPPPAVVLYPHRLGRSDAGVAGRGARTPEPGDLAAAAAHHAAVRQRARQQQYEQLEAQGGPDHPPSLRRGNLTPGLAAGPEGDLGEAPHTDGLQPRHSPHQPHGAAPPQQPPLQLQGLRGGVPPAHHPQQHRHLPQLHHHQPQQLQALPPQQRHARQQQRQTPRAQPNTQRHHHPAAYPTHHHQPQQQVQQQGPGAGRALLPPDAGGGSCITGVKQRLLAHLFVSCLRAHPNNPKRQQREALALFRQLDTFRSLVMRRVYILDRRRLLIDLRRPAAADLGPAALGGGAAAHPASAPGLPPSQFFLLFDLETTRVLRFEPSPGDCVIESYIREASSAAEYPWTESLPLWDRYVYDNVVAAARSKLRCGGSGSGVSAAGPILHGSVGDGLHGGAAAEGAGTSAGPPATNTGAAAAERASCASKLMQLMPPLSGSCGVSSSPYLDASLYNYDERVVSPYIRTRPCLEQPVFFRLRNRPDRAVFRLDPGPYEAVVVRDRRLARSVTHLFHPDAPFVLTVLSVFQQSTLNINFRL